MTVVAVTLVMLAGPPPPLVTATPQRVMPGTVESVCAGECRERHQCRRGSIVSCIDRAALHHHVSRWLLRRKAWCESRMNPSAWNPSGASGLFQFLPSTWWTTPYRRRSIWSAKWNALAAAWMHRVGRGGEWACQ